MKGPGMKSIMKSIMQSMVRYGWAGLYAALALSANAGYAGAGYAGDVSGLLTGQMQKIILTEPAKPAPEVGFVTMDESPVSLADYKGQWVVLNFWATWCAPCREEMPSLNRLQTARPDIAVIAVATGPNALPAIERFWQDARITGFQSMRDPTRALSSAMGVLGLPVTLILDPEGREVARLIGGADWDAPEALALLDALAQP